MGLHAGRTTAAAIAAAGLALAAGAVAAPAEKRARVAAAGDDAGHGRAKNVILFIGDGMGTSHIDAARLRYFGAEGALNMERLPVHGTVTTYAVEERSRKPEYVTDSASSATAW